MKKLFAFVCMLALATSLSFAQAGGGKPENNTPSASPAQGDATAQPSTPAKKTTKAKKTKKAKKGADDSATPAPTATPK